MKRSGAALQTTGYEALLVHAGTPPLLFLDDHHLPFNAQAPFKVWAPLTDAPDSFVYLHARQKTAAAASTSPSTTGTSLPSCRDTYWSAAFEIVSCADRAASRAALPRDLSRTAFIGAPFPELLAGA